MRMANPAAATSRVVLVVVLISPSLRIIFVKDLGALSAG
jgi:hypothetical protein